MFIFGRMEVYDFRQVLKNHEKLLAIYRAEDINSWLKPIPERNYLRIK